MPMTGLPVDVVLYSGYGCCFGGPSLDKIKRQPYGKYFKERLPNADKSRTESDRHELHETISN